MWGVANLQLWAGGALKDTASASSPEGTARRCIQGDLGVLEGRSEAHRWLMLRCSCSWLPTAPGSPLPGLTPRLSSSRAFFWAPQSKDPDEATLTSVCPALLHLLWVFLCVGHTHRSDGQSPCVRRPPRGSRGPPGLPVLITSLSVFTRPFQLPLFIDFVCAPLPMDFSTALCWIYL